MEHRHEMRQLSCHSRDLNVESGVEIGILMVK